MNGLDSTSEGGQQAPVLPALKRRNSGKRNLHKPWTATEEEQLVKLVDQPEYRKEVSECLKANLQDLFDI